MSFGGFWKSVGMGLAQVGKGAAKGALWASQHPEVIASVATISGHPKVGSAIRDAEPLFGAINRDAK